MAAEAPIAVNCGVRVTSLSACARKAAGLAAFALLLGAAAQKSPERAAFGGLLNYKLPEGWSVDKLSLITGPDAVELWGGLHGGERHIRIELHPGAPESSDAVAGLMKAPWDSDDARPAQRTGDVVVAGRKTPLWRRTLSPKYVEEPGQARRYYLDEFCAVPLKGRFVLLVLSIESGSPFINDEAAERDWRVFLDSVRIREVTPPR